MSDLPPYIFDHVDRRLARLISRLRKPNIEILVRMYGEALEELEDSAYNLIVERFITTSVGAQLDVWGIIVGERRNGLTDGDYRAFIEARILSNLSNGEINRLTQILSVIGRSIGPVIYHPLYPAGMWFSYPTSSPASSTTAERIVTQMTEVAPAGVEVAYIVETTETPFAFAGPDDEGRGFGVGEFGGLL